MAWRSLLLLALVVGATAADPEDINMCQSCRSLVSLATRFNSSIDRQANMELIKGFCEQYYPPSTDFQQGPCPMFVNGLFYILENTDPVTHCDDIGACGPKQPSDDIYQYLQSSNDVFDATSRGADEGVCDFCQNILGQLKATLSDPQLANMIRTRINQFCDYLKVVDQDRVCRESITKYLDCFERMVQRIDTRGYCAAIHMCPRRSFRATKEKVRLPTLADFSNFGLETSASIGSKPTDLDSTGHRTGAQCTLCKTIVKEMFNFLRENKTEEKIEKGLDLVCKLVYPKEPGLSECESMVKAYTKEIVQLLMDETDPELICMLLDQCVYSTIPPERQINHSAAHDKDYDLAHLITALEPTIGIRSQHACIECKMFIRFLRDKLDNPRSQAELKQWLLDNLCRQMPNAALVQTCSKMVEDYAEIFFRAVAQDMNPQAACVELGVCNERTPVQVVLIGGPTEGPSIASDQPGMKALRRAMMSKERKCARCTDVVSFIDDYLATHPMSEDIATMSKVCNNSDNSLIRSECMDIVKQHGTDIVQLIPTMESPRHLCQLISLC